MTGVRLLPDDSVLVLAYHAIADLPVSSSIRPYSVPAGEFRLQLDAVERAGYRFIDLDAVLAGLDRMAPMPKRAVLITFDDCYEDLRTVAGPLLASRGIPAVAFAVGDRLGGANEWDAAGGAEPLRLLDEKGLRELRHLGIEVGAHSLTHPALTTLNSRELAVEVEGSRERLEAVGVPRPRAFAYPYGRHDAAVVSAVKRAGFRIAFSTESGVVTSRTDRYRAPRMEVRMGDTGIRLRVRLLAARAPAVVRRAARIRRRPRGDAGRSESSGVDVGAEGRFVRNTRADGDPPRSGDAPTFSPILVGEIDLADDASVSAAARRLHGPYRRARVLVRVHRQPLGFLEIDLSPNPVSREELLAHVDRRLGAELRRHLERDGLPAAPASAGAIPCPADPPCVRAGRYGQCSSPVSVVVCTRDRVDSLHRTLMSVLAIDYPEFEVVVVDSAPRTAATRALVSQLADPRLRLVTTRTPGLSVARNCGISESRNRIVAFTDDDVIVDAWWLRGLVRGFTRSPDVACVTGMVPAAQLDTPAQSYFDSKVGWAGSMDPRLYDLESHRIDAPLYPYLPGTFGAGANFAVSRAAFADLGRFDEALGAGSPAQGGEDLDFFLRCILAGHAIAYEPAALVWHVHRRDVRVLRSQLVGYGSGLSAFVFKHLVQRDTALEVLRRVPSGIRRMGELRTRTDPAPELPDRVWTAELAGLARGPSRYVRGRLTAPRKLGPRGTDRPATVSPPPVAEPSSTPPWPARY